MEDLRNGGGGGVLVIGAWFWSGGRGGGLIPIHRLCEAVPTIIARNLLSGSQKADKKYTGDWYNWFAEGEIFCI